jgi:phosphatidylserine decarboxylase
LAERLLIGFLSILPKKWLSALAGRFARSRYSRPLIRPFARRFQINLDEAALPLEAYPTLLDFFTRELKPGLRPIPTDPNLLVSPVDGAVAQCGRLDSGELIQAKGHTYTAAALLGDEEEAKRYLGGYYITIYLSPRDYHRIHTPAEGKVVGATYVPGTLWPVNNSGVNRVPGLFAKNERLITYLETAFGRLALVKVGATIVGSVKVVYDPNLGTNVLRGQLDRRVIQDGPTLTKGAELGRFEFGSTVILLVEPGPYTWAPAIQPGAAVRLGQPLLRKEA